MFKPVDWIDEIRDAQTQELIQQGTDQSAGNFKNDSFGTVDANVAGALLLQYFLEFDRDMRASAAGQAAELAVEVQTVNLTNSLAAKWPNNNSQQSVVFTTNRKTLNYDVEVEVVSATGNIGEIHASDRQLNGFKIAYDGSASAATLKIRIKGGMLS